MDAKYITTMISALKDFDNSYNHGDYEALAWVGLRGTSSYKSLPETKTDSINAILKGLKDNEKQNKCK